MIVYLPALRAGFIWDDNAYVYENTTLQTWGGILRIWFDPMSIPQYYPLVHSTFWIEYRLWGDHPFGYHLNNLLLHIASSGLLFFVVRRLALPGALFAAGVFALHPVMVESVAWVTERKNVLSMLFYLLATLQYLSYAGLDGREGPAAATGRKAWWFALAFFAGALTSKSVTFSWPFTMLLITWWKRGHITASNVKDLVPFMVLGIAYGIATSLIERYHVGASGEEWSETLAQKCLIAGRVPWFYLYKLAWPLELTFIYERWVVDPTQLWQYLFPLASIGLIAALVLLRGRIGRGPLAAVLMFGGTLFPAIGFISVYPFRYSFVADHFQYHASLGIIVLVCAVLAWAIPARVGVPLAVIALGLFGVKTWDQSTRYESKEVLYDSILADVPDSWFAYTNLGAIYVLRDEIDKGFEYYKRSKELHPAMTPPGRHISPEAYAHCMVGEMIGNAHSLRPALEALMARRPQEALRLVPEVEPWLLRAIAHFEKSSALSPEYLDPVTDLAKMYLSWGRLTPNMADSIGRLKTAVEFFESGLRMAPENLYVWDRAIKVHLELAERFAMIGQTDEAENHRRRAGEILVKDPERRRD